MQIHAIYPTLTRTCMDVFVFGEVADKVWFSKFVLV